MDIAREDKIWEIRQSAGMVFQNPDNQIIATVVEEDVGFVIKRTVTCSFLFNSRIV